MEQLRESCYPDPTGTAACTDFNAGAKPSRAGAAISDVGFFEGASYVARGMYRPVDELPDARAIGRPIARSAYTR